MVWGRLKGIAERARHGDPRGEVLPDFAGDFYLAVLERLHDALQPRTYFEIGTCFGFSLALSRCAAIAVDPAFRITEPEIVAKMIDRPSLMLFQSTSDAFFAKQDPVRLFGQPIEFAFLDGMHRCEFLLRDFINAERHCRPNSMIALHDCLPVEGSMTARNPGALTPSERHRSDWWTGDVWRTVLYLKRHRRDLDITCLDAAETGLVLVSGLDPAFHRSRWDYDAAVRTMLGWNLREIGLRSLFDELGVETTDTLRHRDQITARYAL